MVKTNRPTLGLIAATAASMLISGVVVAQDTSTDPEQPREAPVVVNSQVEGSLVDGSVEASSPATESEVMADPGIEAAPPDDAETTIGDIAPPAFIASPVGLAMCDGLPTRRVPCLR